MDQWENNPPEDENYFEIKDKNPFIISKYPNFGNKESILNNATKNTNNLQSPWQINSSNNVQHPWQQRKQISKTEPNEFQYNNITKNATRTQFSEIQRNYEENHNKEKKSSPDKYRRTRNHAINKLPAKKQKVSRQNTIFQKRKVSNEDQLDKFKKHLQETILRENIIRMNHKRRNNNQLKKLLTGSKERIRYYREEMENYQRKVDRKKAIDLIKRQKEDEDKATSAKALKPLTESKIPISDYEYKFTKPKTKFQFNQENSPTVKQWKRKLQRTTKRSTQYLLPQKNQHIFKTCQTE